MISPGTSLEISDTVSDGLNQDLYFKSPRSDCHCLSNTYLMIHKVMKKNMSIEDYLKNSIIYKKNPFKKKKKLRNKTESEISELYQVNKLLTL